MTREQAEAQLATAQAKLEALQADLYKVGSREAELRTKLLRHTAAVLAASLRQKEQEDEGLSTPAAAHTLSPALGSPAAASHLRATPSSTGSNRFDGAHFFAGNREAIVPRARTISANGTVGSPYASPQLGASGSFGVNAVQLEHEVAERDARIKELEAQASSLERRLVEVQQQAEADVRAVREALDRKEPEAREEQERTRRELSSAQADVKGLREELHAARDDVEHARRQHEVLRREADEARREAEEHRSRLSLSRSSPSADDAQGEVDAASKLRDQALELAETQHKLEEAEERVVELEEELQRTEEEMKDERRSWEDKVREAEAAGSAASAPLASRVGEVDDDERVEESRRRIEQLEGERQSVVQAISDVLRRHRTRPTLGAALREAPSLDDDLEGRQDLPAYLASTLDAHFDRASSHVEGLGSDLSALHEQRDLRAGIEDEVAQAHERVQALEADVESLQAERDSLETELDLLRSQTHDHEARLSMVPQLEADLKTARDAATQAQRELAGAQSRLAELDALVATQDKQLQDLWRTIPPLEGRTRANSELNDLSSLRTAFEASSPQQPARKPIGALLKNAIGAGGSSSEAGDAVSASGDYSVEALVARVELLLAEDQKLVQKLVALEGEQGAKGDAQDKKVRAASPPLVCVSCAHCRCLNADCRARGAARGVGQPGGHDARAAQRVRPCSSSPQRDSTRLTRGPLPPSLTESLEQTRAEKRKLEADQAQLHEQLAVAQRSPTPAPAAPTDESEMQELRDQIADLEEELADAQRREQKTRAQLLDVRSFLCASLSLLAAVPVELTAARGPARRS